VGNTLSAQLGDDATFPRSDHTLCMAEQSLAETSPLQGQFSIKALVFRPFFN